MRSHVKVAWSAFDPHWWLQTFVAIHPPADNEKWQTTSGDPYSTFCCHRCAPFVFVAYFSRISYTQPYIRTICASRCDETICSQGRHTTVQQWDNHIPRPCVLVRESPRLRISHQIDQTDIYRNIGIISVVDSLSWCSWLSDHQKVEDKNFEFE